MSLARNHFEVSSATWKNTLRRNETLYGMRTTHISKQEKKCLFSKTNQPHL